MGKEKILKGLILMIMLGVSVLLLEACAGKSTVITGENKEVKGYKIDGRFVKYGEGTKIVNETMEIIEDTNTGCIYIVYSHTPSQNGMTALLDEKGEPECGK